ALSPPRRAGAPSRAAGAGHGVCGPRPKRGPRHVGILPPGDRGGPRLGTADSLSTRTWAPHEPASIVEAAFRVTAQTMTVAAVRHVIIHGRVQGVGYRAWVEHMAQRRRLRGWVRNRHDGTVEAVFTGPAAAVTAMIEACRRGPPGARVESVDVR